MDDLYILAAVLPLP